MLDFYNKINQNTIISFNFKAPKTINFKMLNYLRKLIYKYYFIQIIASYVFSYLYFLTNKKKIRIYYENQAWIHETFLGNFASTHPIRKSEKYLMNDLPFFLKYYECKQGDIIFDAGAGIGTETIYFSKLVGNSGKVFALEANPQVYKLLLKTIELNKIKNVVPINLAVYSSSNQNVKFKSNMMEWLGGGINEISGNISVKTISFDDIIENYKIKKINFAKFNIEGSEKYLLSGKKNFIKICENVCISCHDFLENNLNNTSESIKILLRDNEFSILQGNQNIKNLRRELLYYLYATRQNNFYVNTNKTDLMNNDYEFFKSLKIK